MPDEQNEKKLKLIGWVADGKNADGEDRVVIKRADNDRVVARCPARMEGRGDVYVFFDQLGIEHRRSHVAFGRVKMAKARDMVVAMLHGLVDFDLEAP